MKAGRLLVGALLAAVVVGTGPGVAADQGRGESPAVVAAAVASGYTVTDLGARPTVEVAAINGGAQVVGFSYRQYGPEISGRRAWVWDPRGGLRYLSSSRTQSSAVGTNDRGQVAGTLFLSSGSRAFRWDARSGMRLMVTPRGYTDAAAVGINASGLVAGTMRRRSDMSERAFVWDPRTGVLRILHPLRGDTETAAVAINSPGQVTGTSKGSRGEHAFRWDPRTGMKGLGSLGGWPTPTAINDVGQVAGISGTRDGEQHAFRWDPASGMRDLGTLGGDNSGANGINNRGEVAGWSHTGTGLHAVRWDARAGMRDLGTLGGTSSEARGINAHGQIVGSSETRSGAWHAFVWDPRRGMRDLGTLRGHDESFASEVNDRGQVAGMIGTNDRAVLWSPRVTVAVRAVSVRTRLYLNVDPNLGAGSWLVRVQKRRADQTWATLPTGYRTRGTAESRTLDLPRGTYRVVVPAQYGYRWSASAAVYLRH